MRVLRNQGFFWISEKSGVNRGFDKSNTLVRYTLPLDNKQIYASKYMLYLPKEENLRNEINKQRKLLEENGMKEVVS